VPAVVALGPYEAVVKNKKRACALHLSFSGQHTYVVEQLQLELSTDVAVVVDIQLVD
jgi:hypothetical protein